MPEFLGLVALREVCDTACPGPWRQLNEAFPDVVVTDTPSERAVADCDNDEIGLFVATFDPTMVETLLEYVEANEARMGAYSDAAALRFEAARRALLGVTSDA